jgi:hypothetical protein
MSRIGGYRHVGRGEKDWFLVGRFVMHIINAFPSPVVAHCETVLGVVHHDIHVTYNFAEAGMAETFCDTKNTMSTPQE